jgi:hypothetical protein
MGLIQPLGDNTLQSGSPARDHRGKHRAARADDTTGFTQRPDPVGPFPKVVERTEQHYGVHR